MENGKKIEQDTNDVAKLKWYHSLFVSTKGSISSKRFCGVIGFFVCLAVAIYCTIMRTESPDIVDMILFTSASLMGIDSVTKVFHK